MRLTVSDMPEFFPAQMASGQALSIFPKVMNLALDTAAGSLVSVDARIDAPSSPGTARLLAPDDLDFTRLVRPGAGLAMRAGVMRIHGSDLTFDFRGANSVAWDGEPAQPHEVSSRSAAGWVDAWSLFLDAPCRSGFAAALFSDAGHSRFERALTRRVRRTVPKLLAAGAAADLPVTWSCLRRLLGAGPGLTPSGDDFATGFFRGYGFRARDGRERGFLHGLARATVGQTQDSSHVSRACLEHAAAGRFSAPLTSLVEGIVTGADNLHARLASVLTMGHSSGHDAAFGALCGLAVPDAGLRACITDKLDITDLDEKAPR